MTIIGSNIGRAVAMLSVSVAALTASASHHAQAQSALPAVTVDAPQQRRAQAKPAPRPARAARTTRRATTPTPRQQNAAPVEAGRGGAGIERANGPVTGYVASRSATGTKTDTPLLETPQSISIVTKDQIADQQSQTVTEALRYTPGVTPDLFGATSVFDNIKLRGFDAPRYLDGLRLPLDPGVQFASPRIETYGLERLEVLRGPSSGLYGQSDPGGLINMVSKRPTATPQNEVEGQFGSFNRFQGAFDIGGPVTKDGEFLYRIVGLARKSDSQTDFVQDNKIFIAPSFTWRPSKDTSFTFLSSYQLIDNKGYQQYLPGQGTLLPNPNGRIPLSRYIGEPGNDTSRLEQGSVGYAFEHRFNDALQFRQNLRYFDVTNTTNSIRSEGLLPDNRSLMRSLNYVTSKSQNVTLDNQLQADFLTGPFAHKMLFGVDYQHTQSSADYRFAMIAPLDVYTPVYGVTPLPARGSLVPFIRTDTTQDQVGAYIQEQLKWNRFTLSLTGRQDWATSKNVSQGFYPPAGTYKTDDSATTGRVGLNYLFDFGLAPYISYSTSFVPVSGAGLSGSAFKPTTGDGKEIGLKYQPVGMNLLLTAAWYEVTQQNVLTADPTNPLFSVQTGEALVRGFEFEARGNLTRELQIVGGYSKLDPRVTKSNTGNVGMYMTSVALETASLWAKYSWQDGALAGLGLGGGVRYVGASYGDDFNTIRTKPYTLVDATLSYDFAYARHEWQGWKAQINVTNLFNRSYISNCFTGLAYCGPGSGRTVLGSLKYAWN